MELERYAALSISSSLHYSIDSVSKGNHNLYYRKLHISGYKLLYCLFEENGYLSFGSSYFKCSGSVE